jgi:hypothetical protein
MEIKGNCEYEILTPYGFKDFQGIKKLKNKYIKFIFENSEEIGVTHNHIFVNNGVEILAKNLNIGDYLQGYETQLKILEINYVNEFTDVYDLIEVNDGNVYYTNNVLSHNCAFIGSGDNVVDAAVLEKQLQTNVKDPIVKDARWDGTLWIWKYPEEGHRYISALDVSRGDSEDSTGYTIIDFDTFEQVLEYHGKVPPDVAALFVNQYSKMYNALTTFDITGGLGIAAINRLKEMLFPPKLYHYDDDDDLTLFYGAPDDKIPGINFASRNRRVQIVQALEEAIVRSGFKIRSIRLINELKKFVYKNGKADHMKNSHDDLIMALGMCLFVANTSFKRLTENIGSTKAMLDSWKVQTNNIQTTATNLLSDVNTLITASNNPGNSNIYSNSEEILKNTRD